MCWDQETLKKVIIIKAKHCCNETEIQALKDYTLQELTNKGWCSCQTEFNNAIDENITF
jgi:hypothetical protein